MPMQGWGVYLRGVLEECGCLGAGGTVKGGGPKKSVHDDMIPWD